MCISMYAIRLHMCTCVLDICTYLRFTYSCTHTHIHTHTYIHTYIHAYMHTYIHIYIYIYIYIVLYTMYGEHCQDLAPASEQRLYDHFVTNVPTIVLLGIVLQDCTSKLQVLHSHSTWLLLEVDLSELRYYKPFSFSISFEPCFFDNKY